MARRGQSRAPDPRIDLPGRWTRADPRPVTGRNCVVRARGVRPAAREPQRRAKWSKSLTGRSHIPPVLPFVAVVPRPAAGSALLHPSSARRPAAPASGRRLEISRNTWILVQRSIVRTDCRPPHGLTILYAPVGGIFRRRARTLNRLRCSQQAFATGRSRDSRQSQPEQVLLLSERLPSLLRSERGRYRRRRFLARMKEASDCSRITSHESLLQSCVA